jgi:hypothetical protein
MALFNSAPASNLEDVLTNQSAYKTAGINDAYTQKRKRLVASEAASGRLMGGVSDYPLADLSFDQGGAVSDVQTGLAEALGQIPAEDWSATREDERKRQLAALIGSLSKRSGGLMGGVTGGLSGALSGATSGLVLSGGNPFGALAGGVAGGALGAYGGSQ